MRPQFIEQVFIAQLPCVRRCSRYWGYSTEKNTLKITAFTEHVCARVWQGQKSGGKQPDQCSSYLWPHNCHPQTQRLKGIATISLAPESAGWTGMLGEGSSWLYGAPIREVHVKAAAGLMHNENQEHLVGTAEKRAVKGIKIPSIFFPPFCGLFPNISWCFLLTL